MPQPAERLSFLDKARPYHGIILEKYSFINNTFYTFINFGL